eukprot:scaffold17592_cov18-Tisochrysis_lutea.AAC.1
MKCGQKDVMRVLLEGHANPDANFLGPDVDNDTPLALATRKEDLEVMQLLLEKGATVDKAS